MSLTIWTVYDHPRDWPDWFVARKFLLDRPTNEIKLARTLEALRRMLPPDLYCMQRQENDDRVIVECWL